MKTLNLVAVILCAASFSGLVTAQEVQEKQSQPVITTDSEKKEFQRLDADKDGAISAEEAKEGNVKSFAKADKNSDGKLTLSEYVAIARNEVSSR